MHTHTPTNIYMHTHTYIQIYISYLLTPPLGQEMTQNQFLSEV